MSAPAPGRDGSPPHRQERGSSAAPVNLSLLDLGLALLLGWCSITNPPEVMSALSADQGILLYTLLAVSCCGFMVLRRRHPTFFVAATGAAMAVHLLAFVEISLLALGVTLLAAETAQSRLMAPWRWMALGAVLVGTGAAGGRAQEAITSQSALMSWVIALTTAWSLVTAASLIGVGRRRARDRVTRAIERAAVLEAQQDTERRLAVAEERQRIARDVHDLLGHSLAVIAMQAEGARAVLATDARAADKALAVIGETSRRSVDEVRALVEVLRTDDAPSADLGAAALIHPVEPHGAPSPDCQTAGLEGIASLAAGARQAGLPLALHLEITREPPGAVGRVLYRAVQECLTNVLRHGGAAPTRVDLRVTARRAELFVSNAAPSAARPREGLPAEYPAGEDRPAGPPAPTAGPGGRRTEDVAPAQDGFGLTSMHERVRALGGSLSAGALPDGGWRVAVVLPLSARTRVPA